MEKRLGRDCTKEGQASGSRATAGTDNIGACDRTSHAPAGTRIREQPYWTDPRPSDGAQPLVEIVATKPQVRPILIAGTLPSCAHE
jgi:hypothetical protein